MFPSFSAKTENVVYDFGTRVLAFRTKKEVAADQGATWLQHVKVRCLGEQFYIAGEWCVLPNGTENPRKGVVYWYLLSEIEQIQEFPNLESARLSWQAYQRLQSAEAMLQTSSHVSELAEPVTGERPGN